jgi:hypothetical protein
MYPSRPQLHNFPLTKIGEENIVENERSRSQQYKEHCPTSEECAIVNRQIDGHCGCESSMMATCHSTLRHSIWTLWRFVFHVFRRRACHQIGESRLKIFRLKIDPVLADTSDSRQ